MIRTTHSIRKQISLLYTVGFLFLFLLPFLGNAQTRLSQQNNSSQKVLPQAGILQNELKREDKTPFDEFKDKKEEISKRDFSSKHYINTDGSYTALIGAGPIHYKKNNSFYDIDHTIATNSNDSEYPFVNETNLFESYFGATAHKGIKNRTQEGEIKEFVNTKMYWEVSGQAVNTSTSSNVAATIQGDKAFYNNIYGNISAEFIIESGRRKLNYIIPNQTALGNVPENADFLVFSEDIVLPQGWTYSINERHGILIIDNHKTIIYNYKNPVSTDANSFIDNNNTIYNLSINNNIITLETKVKIGWLLNNARQFPIKVDPTVSYYPNASTHRTAQLLQSGGGSYGNMAVGYNGGFYRSYASFDVTGIPDSATINTVVLTHNVGATTGMIAGSFGSEIRAFLTDPESSSYPTWISVYNAVINTTNSPISYVTVSNLNTTGSKNVTLGTTANTHLQNSLSANKFTISYRPAGNYTTTPARVAQFYGESDATRKPYLSVTYTEANVPPSCATLIVPANSATEVAHQGQLSWNAVAGATLYDVYFGTGSTPPIVSTNQTGTTYNIGGCLLPNTQYYWRIVPKNANGSATSCATWSFTTDGKLNIYKNDWETANNGFFGTSGTSVDGWFTNNNTGTGGGTFGYNNTWTIGDGPNAVSGKSAGITALLDNGLAGNFFQYWSDLGEIHRWIYRPFDMRGLRDIEVTFRWKAGGENNQDYGSVISSINSGSNWATETQGGLTNDGKYWNSPTTIRTQSITFANTRNNQQNFVLGFKWDDMSGNGISTDPSFVVDDIVIKACPYEGNIISNVVGQGIYEWIPTASTQATLTINGSHTCAQYQWEQSTDNGLNWTNVVGGSGATTVSYTTPSDLAITTLYRCKVYFGTGCTGAYQDTSFEISIIPSCDAEIINVTNNSGCGAITLEAQGSASTTEYRWYDAEVGGNLVDTTTIGEWTTPVLTQTTTYYVSSYNGECESARVAVTATFTPTDAEIIFTEGASTCEPGNVTLFAETSNDGIYTVNWYDAETGGNLVHTGFTYTVSLAQTTLFYVAAAEGSCESERIEITATINSKTWNGSVSTDWNTGDNWTPSGVPTSSNCVVIADVTNAPILSTGNEGFAKSLTLLENASLLVQSEATLTVTETVNLAVDAITEETLATFTIENDGYLVQTQNTATNSNVGKITVNKNSNPMFRLEATGWGSPVENQKLYDFAVGTVFGRVYFYDETANAFSASGITTNSVFELGRGYSVRAPNTYNSYNETATPTVFEGLFYGRPNNGDIGINVTANNLGYNYVGNPYPSPIDAEEFLSSNSNVASLHFWTHEAPPIDGAYAANNYASFTTMGGTMAAAGGEEPDGIIQVGQGFVIKAEQQFLLQFTNDLRIPNSNGQFFRSANTEKHRMWLNLNDSTTNYNQILLGYVENATMAVDHQIDAKLFGYSDNSIYSLIDNEKYVIQGRSLPFDVQDVVPLGFKATHAGTFTINISKKDGLFENDQIIYLRDLNLGIIHNLTEADYTFLTEIGTFESRFEIVYQNEPLSIDETSLNNSNWIVYKDNVKQTITVESKGFEIDEIEIYDLTGRLLLHQKDVNSDTFICQNNFADQVLLVKINKTLVKKAL